MVVRFVDRQTESIIQSASGVRHDTLGQTLKSFTSRDARIGSDILQFFPVTVVMMSFWSIRPSTTTTVILQKIKL
jgi:hypothetical protein